MKTKEEITQAHDHLVAMHNAALDLDIPQDKSKIAATIFAFKWVLALQADEITKSIDRMILIGKELDAAGGDPDQLGPEPEPDPSPRFGNN
jgi:hypothetical protein